VNTSCIYISEYIGEHIGEHIVTIYWWQVAAVRREAKLVEDAEKEKRKQERDWIAEERRLAREAAAEQAPEENGVEGDAEMAEDEAEEEEEEEEEVEEEEVTLV
jgi:hypothetical protein